MSLHNLSSKMGRKRRKRVGRGNSSGHGTYSTRGGKGQTARKSGTRRPGFEGGQTPLIRKVPKTKGFKNPKRKEYQIITTSSLNIFENNATINIEILYSKNLIAKKTIPVKLLRGSENLEKTINLTIHKASASAIKDLEAKKGKITLIEKREKKTEEPAEEPKKTEKKVKSKKQGKTLEAKT